MPGPACPMSGSERIWSNHCSKGRCCCRGGLVRWGLGIVGMAGRLVRDLGRAPGGVQAT